MTNDFKTRIENFQKNGDRMIIDEILYGLTFDFMNDPTRRHYNVGNKLQVHINLPRHEYYISYRVKVLREFALKEYNGVPRGAEYEDFCYYLTVLKYKYRINHGAEVLSFNPEMELFRLTAALFEELDAKRDIIEENVYEYDLEGLDRGISKLRDKITSLEAMRDVTTEQVDANIVQALERALGYVDASKSEREIVRYINSAFSTKFGEMELERKGIKRIFRVNNQANTVKLFVKHHFPKDDYSVILPELKAHHLPKLTKQQAEFVKQALEIVQFDNGMHDLSNYSCRANGAAVIKRDYLAEKLGKSGESVRKVLSRIKKTVTN